MSLRGPIPGPFSPEVTLPKETSPFAVQGNFRHEDSGAPVSREELMTVLSQLEGLYIRGLHFTETQRLTLGEVGLEEASDTGSGPRAHLVEMCACPPVYTGDSCQVGFPQPRIPHFLGPSSASGLVWLLSSNGPQLGLSLLGSSKCAGLGLASSRDSL